MGSHDLWYIVNMVKSDIDALNTKNDLKYLTFAIEGFRELNNYGLVLPAGKTVKIALDENNSAPLPDDFVDYYKIGICKDGYIVNFDLNETICLDRSEPCSCDVIESTLNSTPSSSSWWNWKCDYLGYVNNNQFVGGIYGLGAGFYRGGYRIDHDLRVIKFDSYVTASSIILEYQSDGGIGLYGNAYIPQILIRPLRNFVHRERCTFEAENMNNAQRANLLMSQSVKFGRRYANGLRAAANQIKGWTTDEMLATWRASFYQTPKR